MEFMELQILKESLEDDIFILKIGIMYEESTMTISAIIVINVNKPKMDFIFEVIIIVIHMKLVKIQIIEIGVD